MKRLISDVRNLQASIPASDLAIQIDCAIEFAHLEYERGRIQDDVFRPYFSPARDFILDRIVELAAFIGRDVWLGFHLCYGDIKHEHFIQPEDAGLLVSIANGIAERVSPYHKVSWIHFPVPKGRTDSAYYEPLKLLNLDVTKLFGGLAKENDPEGTVVRLKMA